MKYQLMIIAVLVALAGCSKADDGRAGKIAAAEDQAESVSHAKPEQVAPGARPASKNKPSELDRLLREGAQEKGAGMGRLNRKRGE